MGRQGDLGSQGLHRRKGAAGTGHQRRRDVKIRRRSAKDAHEQLAALRAGDVGKKRKKKKAKKDGSDSGDEHGEDCQSQKKAAPATKGKSAGFEKAYKPEVLEAIPFPRCFWAGPDPPEGEPSDELKQARRQIGIKVRGASIPPPIEHFSDSGLPSSLHQLFQGKRKGGLGLEKPTPIQQQVWPAALCGLDIIGIAPTGSGKTLAYLAPAVPHILGQQAAAKEAAPPGAPPPKPLGVVCLVLVPTRELAKQVSDSCGGSGANGWLKRLFGLRASAVYGGMGKEMQLDTIVTLGMPHILVATPGRLLDLLSLGVVSLANVSYLVLDEGDRMLALGFEPQLSAIMKSIRPNRQLLLFSATFPGKLRESAEQWMSPQRVVIRVAALELSSGAAGDGNDDDEADAEGEGRGEGESGEAHGSSAAAGSGRSTLTVSKTIEQSVEVCPEHKRPKRLVRYLRAMRRMERKDGRRQRSAVLIFCSQIKTLRAVAKSLEKHGERCAPLHSGLPQAKREQALVELKNGTVDTLVATDVASRGLHISRLRYVVNYEFPSSIEVYCHRIGRVGRSGAQGWAYSFLGKSDAPHAAGLMALLSSSNQRVDDNLKILSEGGEPTFAADDSESSCDEGQGRTLRVGVKVRLHGLQGRTDLNGLSGRVQREVAGTGRWEVALESGDTKAIKAENLELVSKPSGSTGAGAGGKPEAASPGKADEQGQHSAKEAEEYEKEDGADSDSDGEEVEQEEKEEEEDGDASDEPQESEEEEDDEDDDDDEDCEGDGTGGVARARRGSQPQQQQQAAAGKKKRQRAPKKQRKANAKAKAKAKAGAGAGFAGKPGKAGIGAWGAFRR